MKKILVVLVSLLAAVPLAAQTSSSRYLIKMRRHASAAALPLVADSTHAAMTYSNFGLVGANLTSAEVAALRKSPDVEYVSPVVPRYVDAQFETPLRFDKAGIETNGRHQQMQTVWYGIDLVKARDVWKYTKGAIGGVNVAVIDTGIDYNHPELKDRYQGGFNAFTGTNDPLDDHGHGTHVSGIIAADDNAIGVVGVAPEAKLWVAKVLKADGSGTDETVVAGLNWVMNKKKELGGNWVVNLSLGASGSSDGERAAFAEAISEGILVVAAAGNTGGNDIQYPGAYDQVLAISAIDINSQLASFSTFGPGVAFASPGVDVLSTVPVGTGRDLEISVGNESVKAYALDGAKDGSVTGKTVFGGFCGTANEIPAEVRGNIAICRRGNEIPFHTKASNAIDKGAIGVIIAANDDRNDNTGWTLLLTCQGCPPDPSLQSYPWGVVLSTTKTDGDALIANIGQTVTLNNTADDYARLSGTSMATPHVTGVSALVWSLAPQLTASDMRLALKLSSDDLGDPGYDGQFGYGRIDALSSAQYVAPALLGVPPPKQPVPTHRHIVGH